MRWCDFEFPFGLQAVLQAFLVKFCKGKEGEEGRRWRRVGSIEGEGGGREDSEELCDVHVHKSATRGWGCSAADCLPACDYFPSKRKAPPSPRLASLLFQQDGPSHRENQVLEEASRALASFVD